MRTGSLQVTPAGYQTVHPSGGSRTVGLERTLRRRAKAVNVAPAMLAADVSYRAARMAHFLCADIIDFVDQSDQPQPMVYTVMEPCKRC